MCGIFGFFNIKNSNYFAISALKMLEHRGREGFGLAGRDWICHSQEIENIKPPGGGDVLGHCLHPIVGRVPQPLQGLTVNCEIYNWQTLSWEYSLEAENDAEMLAKLLEKEGVEKTVEMLDGDYAFAYWEGEVVYLARDIFGVKPLWYSLNPGLAFASEGKVLRRLGFNPVFELNPREILCYNTKTRKAAFKYRKTLPKLDGLEERGEESLRAEFSRLLREAVVKRIPEERFGILFSGGVDSTVLARICQEEGADFTCYTAGIEGSQDLFFAEKAARELGFPLKARSLPASWAEEMLGVVVPLVEDVNVAKIGVALTLFAACEHARKDGIRIMFSGSGSDELLAGYHRHQDNQDCYSDLLKIYEKNTYRDDVVTMYHTIELRVPYLDKRLAEMAVKLPVEFKLNSRQNKLILRRTARELGIPSWITDRPKKAAQYGSKIHQTLNKLARKNKKTISAYLRQFYPPGGPRLAVLWSTGKDSNYALHILKRQNYNIVCLVTLTSKNPDSYMFHTPTVQLSRLQAEALGIPLLIEETAGEEETELTDLKKALKRAKWEYSAEGIATGAIYSNYQRTRIEETADQLGLKIFSPLWHTDQETEMRELLQAGFRFIFTSIAAEGLDPSWLGREITEKDIEKLKELHKKKGLNIAGEGGEFESLVIDGPDYKKTIEIQEAKKTREGEHRARLHIIKAKLKGKNMLKQ